jgi:hypothetical protein
MLRGGRPPADGVISAPSGRGASHLMRRNVTNQNIYEKAF